MFSHEMKEKEETVITLKYISPSGFSAMLDYFYHGRVTVRHELDILEAVIFVHVIYLTNKLPDWPNCSRKMLASGFKGSLYITKLVSFWLLKANTTTTCLEPRLWYFSSLCRHCAGMFKQKPLASSTYATIIQCSYMYTVSTLVRFKDI